MSRRFFSQYFLRFRFSRAAFLSARRRVLSTRTGVRLALLSPIIGYNSMSQDKEHGSGGGQQNAAQNPRQSAQAGRVGTLTSEQEGTLKELWQNVLQVFVEPPAVQTTEKGKGKKLGFLKKKHEEDKYAQREDYQEAISTQSPEELRSVFWATVKCDDPDALLLRFLRARKWDVSQALVMLVSTLAWRSGRQHDVETLMAKGEAGAIESKDDGFMSQLRVGKSYLHGCDRTGRPITVVSARLHHSGDQSDDAMQRYTIYIMESTRMLLRDPVDTAAVIFDLHDFSLANMDYAPVKFMIKCFEAHYPESLGVCIVYRAPWVFQGVWSIIKGWLDPVVASKIHFISSTSDLEKFISPDRVSKQLGGNVDWEYKYVEPAAGENDRMNDSKTKDEISKLRMDIIGELEQLTRKWVEGAQDVTSVRNHTKQALRENYWKLDPYIRARTILDRTGVLSDGGHVDM